MKTYKEILTAIEVQGRLGNKQTVAMLRKNNIAPLPEGASWPKTYRESLLDLAADDLAAWIKWYRALKNEAAENEKNDRSEKADVQSILRDGGIPSWFGN
jgi:accessory colonization factor AcfC